MPLFDFQHIIIKIYLKIIMILKKNYNYTN